MDDQKKDAARVKYIKKCENLAKSTILSAEKAYRSTLNEKNAVAAIGEAAITLGLALSPMLYFLAAYLLSGTHLILGTYPMGLAFVSAVGKRMPSAYIGAVLGALSFSSSPVMDISVYTLIICLRRLTAIISEPERKLTDFEDSLKIKLAVSLIVSTALGAYGSIESDFSLASLGALLIYIAVTPSLTFLYACTVSMQKGDATVLYEEISKFSLTVSLVISLKLLSFANIDVSCVGGLVAVLYITRKHGILKGSLVGLFLGLSGAPSLTPVYSLAAVISGILYSSSPYLAVASATLASVSWTVYAGGYSLAASSAPSLMIGGLIASVGVYGDFFTLQSEKDERLLPHSSVLRAEILKNSDTDMLLSSEAKAFTELSEMLTRLSDRLCRPTLYDVRESVRKCRSSVCRKCDAAEVCRKLNGNEISDAWDELAALLYEHGSIAEEDIPHAFTENCRHSEVISDRVSEAYASTLKKLIETDKAEVMALDYRAVSAVLSDIMDRRDKSFSVDRVLSERLLSRLKKEKISVGGVTVYGSKHKTVFISSLKAGGLHIGENDLSRIVSEVCGGAFSSPEFDLRGTSVNATLRSTAAFSAVYATSRLTENESRACGDSCSCFTSKNGHLFALISDGMGSGHEAALTSGMSVMFTEKMLSAGMSASVTLKMLNSIIRAKGTECSATVDLCDIDLVSGELEFYKSGASPTLILRNSDIYKVESHTLPVGIIRSLDAQKTKIKAETGDLIVMFSDGIAEGDEDSAWLYGLLSEVRDMKCDDIAEAVISEAERRYKRKDDATVCVIRVTPPQKNEISF